MGVIQRLQRKNKNGYTLRIGGYTLIELIVVVTMLGLIMPAIFNILYAILQQQLKVYRITETKRQGDYILELMKEKITRETATIYTPGAPNTPRCSTVNSTFTSLTSGADFHFAYELGGNFWFYRSGNNLLYGDSNVLPGSPSTLNNTKVRISNFTISCFRRATVTLVGFAYDVTFYDATPSTEEGTVRLHYVSKVKLR